MAAGTAWTGSVDTSEKSTQNYMKRIYFIMAAAAAVAAVSCGPKVSEKTLIAGSFENNVPDEVSFKAKDFIDTTVAVTDGKFSIELPTSKTTTVMLTAGSNRAMFIPDGTKLTLAIDQEGNVEITSETPEISIQEKYNAFNKEIGTLQETFQKAMADIKDDEEAAEKAYNEYEAAAKECMTNTFEANKDNAIGVNIFRNLQYDLPIDEVDSILQTFDAAVAEVPVIKTIKDNVEAKKATAEGKMFTDFEVDGVKFSDYVGKGKYMLVDFWASWCGPCKREIPNIKKVYEKYAGNEFDVLSVAVWDEPQATRDTAKVYGVCWNEIVNAQRIPTDIYGIQGIPHIMLVGPDGTILKRDLRGEGIEEEVSKYVKAVK